MLTSKLLMAGLALRTFFAPRLRRLRLVAILATTSFALAIPAVGFLGFAGYHALGSRMSATEAALVVAGTMFAACAILVLTAIWVMRRAPSEIGAVLAESQSFVEPLREGIRSRPGASTTTAAVLGVVVGLILPLLRRP